MNNVEEKQWQVDNAPEGDRGTESLYCRQCRQHHIRDRNRRSAIGIVRTHTYIWLKPMRYSSAWTIEGYSLCKCWISF